MTIDCYQYEYDYFSSFQTLMSAPCSETFVSMASVKMSLACSDATVNRDTSLMIQVETAQVSLFEICTEVVRSSISLDRYTS